MGLLVCCTPTLLTIPNPIICVLHPKPPHQSQSDYWGAAPQISSPVSIRLLGYCTPNLLTSLPMGLLGCCTPNLLTSLPMGLLGCCTPNLLTSLKEVICVLNNKPPHKSNWDKPRI